VSREDIEATRGVELYDGERSLDQQPWYSSVVQVGQRQTATVHQEVGGAVTPCRTDHQRTTILGTSQSVRGEACPHSGHCSPAQELPQGQQRPVKTSTL